MAAGALGSTKDREISGAIDDVGAALAMVPALGAAIDCEGTAAKTALRADRITTWAGNAVAARMPVAIVATQATATPKAASALCRGAPRTA